MAKGGSSNSDGITTRQIAQPVTGPQPDSSSPGTGGTVTSVALAVPGRQSVTGSPVTRSGTMTISDDAQNANQVFAGPASGSPAVPGFRALVAADIPSLTSEGTTTSTGNQDDFAHGSPSVLRCNNASLLTLRGLAAGVAGQQIVIVSVGAGQVDLANEDTNSTAANRIVNGVTGTISLAGGSGRAVLCYDATSARWRVIAHEQGAWISVPYSAGDFTASGSMTWTVESGDLQTFSYLLRGRTLSIALGVSASSIGGTLSNGLLVAIPGGFSAPVLTQVPCIVSDSAIGTSIGRWFASGTSLTIRRADGSNFAASTNNAGVQASIAFEVS